MSTSKYFDRICAIVLVCALVITVLFMNGQSLGITLVVDADSEAHSDNEYFTDNDRLSDWDISSATYITLEGDEVSISGNNAYEYDGNVMISGSGKYVITGTLDDGYITVDANANSKVWILLNGVDISCSDNACLRVDEADKVFLTLADETTNILTGGEDLSDEALEDGTYGVIFAHDDLTINGSGSLQINAGYRHGIKANDDLVITGGTIVIDAPADGIHVNDSFRLKDASATITAGDDGILTENEESFFYLESGMITIDAKGDGIHSNGDVIIAGGTITMDAGDDGIHAEKDIEIEGGLILMNSCYEGIEGVAITVSGGDITIYPTDDGFNASSGSTSETDLFGNGQGSPGGMAQSKGGEQPPERQEFSSENGMQPPERQEFSSESGSASLDMPESTSDTKNAVSDGAAEETQMISSESSGPGGMPGNTGNAPGQDGMAPPALPEKDGMPAQAQETGNEQQEMQQEQQDIQQDTENHIRISGGTVTIINENGNDADGLDSNGDIFITGGDIRISLKDNGTNSAIDVATENGGVTEISGGTIIACGSSSMAEAFDSTSEQCSFLYNISSGMEAETLLSVKNGDGEEILSWTVPCSFSSAVISCPEMITGQTYTIAAGDNEETITLTEVSASFGDAQSTMFGGSMNWGGMQKRERRTQEGSGGMDPAGFRESDTGMTEEIDPAAGRGNDVEQVTGGTSAGESAEETISPEAGEEHETVTVTEQQPDISPAVPADQRTKEINPDKAGSGPIMSDQQAMAKMSENASDAEEDSSVAADDKSYDEKIYILLLISFLVLGAGLVFAKKYKRY